MSHEGPTDEAAARAGRIPRPVQLLWTGGWDSTFQLLRLLLGYRLPVMPVYLEDPTRASTSTELRTIDRIRAALEHSFPHVCEALLPLQRFRVADLQSDPEITGALRTVRERIHIGSQYEWLALFCRQHGVDNIELSVHVDDKVQALLSSFVTPYTQAGTYRSFRVDPKHDGTAEYTLFGRFGFPLFGIDKTAMGAEAAREGWSDFMDMTWFCHRPLGGKPCGACAPCAYAIEEGMAWRVPTSRRVLSYPYRALARPLKPALRAALAKLNH